MGIRDIVGLDDIDGADDGSVDNDGARLGAKTIGLADGNFVGSSVSINHQ